MQTFRYLSADIAADF